MKSTKLQKLGKSKARGTDAIPPVLYVRTAGTLFLSLYNVYRNIVRTSQFPFKWNEAKVTQALKNGLQKKVENYRTVSLLNIGCKTFQER